MKRLFICHPLRSAPTGFAEVCRVLCGEIVRETAAGLGGSGLLPEILPLAPQAYLPSFLATSGAEDAFAVRACLELVELSDAVLVVAYNGKISEGMRGEIEAARHWRKPLISVPVLPSEELFEDAAGGNVVAAAALAREVAAAAFGRLREHWAE